MGAGTGISTPEALRVPRPGGALVLWWNVSDHAVPWVAGQDTRLRHFFRDEAGAEDESAHGAPARTRGLLPELTFVHRRVPWTPALPRRGTRASRADPLTARPSPVP